MRFPTLALLFVLCGCSGDSGAPPPPEPLAQDPPGNLRSASLLIAETRRLVIARQQPITFSDLLAAVKSTPQLSWAAPEVTVIPTEAPRIISWRDEVLPTGDVLPRRPSFGVASAEGQLVPTKPLVVKLSVDKEIAAYLHLESGALRVTLTHSQPSLLEKVRKHLSELADRLGAELREHGSFAGRRVKGLPFPSASTPVSNR